MILSSNVPAPATLPSSSLFSMVPDSAALLSTSLFSMVLAPPHYPPSHNPLSYQSLFYYRLSHHPVSYRPLSTDCRLLHHPFKPSSLVLPCVYSPCGTIPCCSVLRYDLFYLGPRLHQSSGIHCNQFSRAYSVTRQIAASPELTSTSSCSL